MASVTTLSKISTSSFSVQETTSKQPTVSNLDSLWVCVFQVEGADLWLLSPPCQPYTRTGLCLDLEDRRAQPLLHLSKLLPKLQQPPEAVAFEAARMVWFNSESIFFDRTQIM